MVDVAVLVLPAANRVYAGSAPSLLAAELAVLDALALGGRLSVPAVEVLGGVPYVTFSGDLDAEALAVVSNASSLYAVFEREGGVLRPVAPARLERWDEDLVTIPRYSGKTNEQLTRLLLNLTVAAAAGSGAFTGRKLRVLDPLCGRGTTLNVAALCGFDAAGVDLDARDVDAYVHFFTTWLKDKRAKHTSRRHGASTTVTFAPDKDAAKAGRTQEVVVVAGDTTSVVSHFGKSSVDAIVVDLPYGVQHGSHSESGLRRSPAELLPTALPAWTSVLRAGGAAGLSWNAKALPRAEMIQMLEAAGFSVVTGDGFAHRVDRTIDRDIVVARRPR